jgi:hypothetical protein
MKTQRSMAIQLASAVAIAALTLGAMPATSVAAGLTCAGKRATVTANQGSVVGTRGDDVIVLTGAATVRAGAGNDLICGSQFADTIFGGTGDDVIFGKAGHDTIDGGAGADHLFGDRGNDRLAGGADDDSLYSGPGSGTLLGGAGENTTSYAPTVIVVRVSNSDMVYLRYVGDSLVVAGKPIDPTNESPVLVATSPKEMNIISVGAAASGFYSEGSLRADTTVNPSDVREMQPGQQLLLAEQGTSANVSVGVGPGPRGTYSVRNSTTREWLSGLGFNVGMNGRGPTMNPLSTSSVAPGLTRLLRKPQELLIGFSSTNQSGTIMPLERLRMTATTSFTAGDAVVFELDDSRLVRR